MKKHLLSLLTGLCVLVLPAVSEAEELWVQETQTLSNGGSYYWYTFTVTAGVWPVAPGHKVGMVYTNDLWRTSHWVDLTWQYNQANAYGSQDEIWKSAAVNASDAAPVWFAIYVEDAYGVRYWNNNNGQNFEISR